MQGFRATRLVSSALAITGAVFSFGSAMAQEKITLKVAEWTNVTHTTQIEGVKAMMAKATELSKGRIQFQLYPSEQLGKAKDMQMLAQSGVADIVNIAPAYITEKFPLSSVVELPSIYEGACLSSYALGRMLKPGALLHEQEFKPKATLK